MMNIIIMASFNDLVQDSWGKGHVKIPFWWANMVQFQMPEPPVLEASIPILQHLYAITKIKSIHSYSVVSYAYHVLI